MNVRFGSLPDAQYSSVERLVSGVERPLTGYQATVCLRPRADVDCLPLLFCSSLLENFSNLSVFFFFGNDRTKRQQGNRRD